MIRRPEIIASLLLFAAVTGHGPRAARHGPGRLEGGGYADEETVRTARETVGHSITLPKWTNPLGFEKDVFTFARIIFWSDPSRPTERGGFRGSFGGGGGRGGGRFGGFGRMGWVVDYPDADLNFSHRLQQLTSMKADPDARVLKLTSPDLADYRSSTGSTSSASRCVPPRSTHCASISRMAVCCS